MSDNQENNNTILLKKITKLIDTHGIVSYKKDFMDKAKKISKSKLSLDENEFIRYIGKLLKKHYSIHTNILPYRKTSNNVSSMKLPLVKFYDKHKIGYVRIFGFVSEFIGLKETIKSKQRRELVINNIKKFVITCVNQNYSIIIDVCDNFGGNLYPMIMGLKSLFVSSIRPVSYGFSFDNNPQHDVYFSYDKSDQHNRIYFNDKFKKKHAHNDLLMIGKIGIIVNKNTSSSGEFVAFLFQGRDNVKIFGEKTAGYLSTNSTLKINNNYIIALTTGLAKNIVGTCRKQYIKPDILCKIVGNNNAFDMCVKWLSK